MQGQVVFLTASLGMLICGVKIAWQETASTIGLRLLSLLLHRPTDLNERECCDRGGKRVSFTSGTFPLTRVFHGARSISARKFVDTTIQCFKL